MRFTVVVIIAVVVAVGAGIAYVSYRQLETGTTVFQRQANLKPDGRGGMCGTAHFKLEARTLGQWLLPIEEGQTLSGSVDVGGEDDADIGLSIYSPSNRLVLYSTKRSHSTQFELDSVVRGKYRFEFDNRHSTFTDKELTVSVCLT